MYSITKYFLKIAAVILIAGKVFAGGISTPCGDMYLGNLKIGQTYSLRSLLGYPFNVTYKGRTMVGLKIGLKLPDEKLTEGFEPIPDVKWIKINKSKFSLDPGQTAETDIIVTIPNEEQYMGKKYMIKLYPQTTAQKDAGAGIALSAGLLCKLKLAISPKPATPEEIRQIQKQQLGQAVNFNVTPERIFLNEVIPGKKINVKKDYNESLKLINSSDFKAKVTIESIPVGKSGIFPPIGYIEANNPKWLKVKKRKITMGKNSIKEIPLVLKLPSDIDRSKRYFFVLSVLVSTPIRNSRYLMKVYVEPKKNESN